MELKLGGKGWFVVHKKEAVAVVVVGSQLLVRPLKL